MATGNYSYWKNCLTMVRAGTGITVDNSDPMKPIINATGGGGGGGIESVVAGDNVTVDDTDPLNPIINAGDGLPKVILWTAYGSNASDMVVTVEYNNTGRTLSVFNTDEGFVLSGAFTQKYMVSRAGAYQSGLPFFAEKYTQGQVGLYLGTNLSDIMGDYTFNDPTAPITFEIRIYE